MPNTRRDFVKTAAGMGLAAGMASAAEPDSFPKRKFGKTGLEVSIMGLGGARTGNLMDHEQAIKTIRRCYELGVTYFDTASAGAYGISHSRMDSMRAQYSSVDFANLEPWKVDQSDTLAALPRYQGD